VKEIGTSLTKKDVFEYLAELLYIQRRIDVLVQYRDVDRSINMFKS